jgi:hypothetical protein
VDLLEFLGARFVGDYGHLHALTPGEVRPRLEQGVHDFNGKPHLLITTWTLVKWLAVLPGAPCSVRRTWR